MKKLLSLFLLSLLLLPSPALAAQGDQPWYMLLLVVVTVSTIISGTLVIRNKKYKTITEKAMLFGAWFWFLIFIQVMFYGIYIGLGKYLT